LDAIEAAEAELLSPARGTLRHRIEHAQLVHPADVPRMAALGVIASMQPIHCTQDRDIAERYWGARSRYGYAWRSLREHGIALAFGSDAPVETLDVLAGVYAAVTRKRQEEPGRAPWYPDEALSVEEAVRAYTAGGAYAAGEEAIKGRLAPGRLADFVVLSADPLAIPPEELPRVAVEMTVIGGTVRYSSSSTSSAPPGSSSSASKGGSDSSSSSSTSSSPPAGIST
jgi:predicted amidohydrolase YtcJ